MSLADPAPRADERRHYGDDEAQLADLFLPRGAGPFPSVIALHGGFWRAENDLAHLGHLCRALAEAGLVVASLEYRRLGMPGVGAREIVADVRAGVAWWQRVAPSLPVRGEPPAVLGHSAGGQLALWVAKESEVRGVVALAPICDLRRGQALGLNHGVIDRLLADLPPETAYRLACPIERLPVGARQILIHGDDDRAVPVAMSESYTERARALGDDVTLHVLTGTGHMELINPESRAFPVVRDALRRL
jgi:acetyl esterase/lipase